MLTGLKIVLRVHVLFERSVDDEVVVVEQLDLLALLFHQDVFARELVDANVRDSTVISACVG